jgi:hypothetical protein
VTEPRTDIDAALTYLEADVYEFRSGYERARIARRISGLSLDSAQRARARKYVLDVVDGEKHCAQQALGQLAHAVADNTTRAALRARLRAPDVRVARRALRTLSRVRHPGLTAADQTAARALVLADAGYTAWLLPNVERLAQWLWSIEWEAELREITRAHGPERAAAKRLVEAIARRRAAREAKRPGP